MAYRRDQDLEFLQHCSDEDLSPLVKVLTERGDGAERLTEELTVSKRYKAHHPRHHKYWDLIAAEIQCFGANTFATMARRGRGVRYREVLVDVCKRLKVKADFDRSVNEIERELLLKCVSDAVERMSSEERANAVRELDLNTTDFSKQAVMAAIQAAARTGGFFTYKLSLIVANAVAKKVLGQGLSFAANIGLVRGVSAFAGPIGWLVTSVWTAVEIAGPAYRVTQPAVVFVALLRMRHEMAKDAHRERPDKIEPSRRQNVVVVEDGRVTEMEAALQQQQQDIQVLSTSQAKHLNFEDDDVLVHVLYIIHPRTKATYLRQAEIAQRLFEEQVLEATNLLQAMGARHVRVESERALSAMASVQGDLSADVGGLEVGGEIHRKDRKRVIFEARRSARRERTSFDASMLQSSIWYRNDPLFGKLADDHASGEMDETVSFEREYDQDALLSGKVQLKVLKKLGIAVAGKSTTRQSVKFAVLAEF